MVVAPSMSLKHIRFGITIIAITIASFFLPTRLANEKSSIVHEGFSKILIYGTFKRQIDPTQVFNPAFLAVLACSFDSLTSISHSGEIQGELVRSWTISPDAKTYEFELAPTKFWNGSTVTSLEVEKSFKRYLSPSSTAVHKELLRSILLDHDWFIKIGQNKFRVRLKRSFPEFLYLMSMADLSIFKIDKFKNIIGTGAYKIAMDSEKNLKLISIRGQKEASVDFVYEKISSGRDISLGQYDYFLGFPPLWSEFLQIPSTHSISFSKRYNIISIQLNPDRREKF